MEQDRHLFFNQLIEQHQHILFKIAGAYCPNPADRQDLVQEMMMQIWQSLHRYNEQYKLSTWLYRLCLNVAISFYRKHGRKASLHTSIDQYTEEIATQQESSLAAIQSNHLQQFISQLQELDKALMILYLEDKSHAEIAEILGISASNVGTKINRIKDKLKKRFAQLKDL